MCMLTIYTLRWAGKHGWARCLVGLEAIRGVTLAVVDVDEDAGVVLVVCIGRVSIVCRTMCFADLARPKTYRRRGS